MFCRSSLVFVLLGFLIVGCSTRDMQEELRNDSTRPGKVGTLVALRTASHALESAKGIRLQPDARCRAGNVSRTTVIELSRRRGPVVVSRWRQVREYDFWSDREQRVTTKAEFSTRANSFEQESASDRRLIGDSLFVGGVGPDSAFYERSATRRDVLLTGVLGAGALQEGLDAVEGWSFTAPGVWGPGESELRCSPLVTAPEWLERFRSRGSLLSAKLEVKGDTRSMEATWAIDQGHELALTVVETPRIRVKIDRPDNLVEVKPDPSFGEARSLLQKLVKSDTQDEETP